MSSLVVKMLTVLVNAISNSQEFLLENAKANPHFSAKILAYIIFNDQSFNNTLTKAIVNFEQLGPG